MHLLRGHLVNSEDVMGLPLSYRDMAFVVEC